MLQHPRPSNERGSAIVLALTLTLVAASLSTAMVMSVTTHHSLVRQSRDGVLSLEACDSGIALARAELTAGLDLDGGGIGNTSGELLGGQYKTATTQLATNRYRIVGTALHGHQRRTVEAIVEIGIIETPPFSFGAFGEEWVTFGGGALGDAWDASLGSYASQAVNHDKYGNVIAQTGCTIASNGPITGNGSGTVINGNVTPGVNSSATLTGGAKVDGSTTPLTKPIVLPDIDTKGVYDSKGSVLPSLKNYSSWSKTGNASWNSNGDLTIQSGGTVTIPGGTYYVNTIKITNNAKLIITGPVVIYLGHGCSASSGSISNTTGIPGNLIMFGLGDSDKVASDKIALSAKDGFFGGVYAPDMDITISGGGNVYGSIVGNTIKDTGGSSFHFDTSLTQYIGGLETMNQPKQISWRKISNAFAP